MTGDPVDRILSREDDILPSSGFVMSVMDAVRQEAATPPPIAFPWLRALPGMIALGVALGALVVLIVRQAGGVAPEPAVAMVSWMANGVKPDLARGLGWGVLALGLSLVSVMFSLRFASGNRTRE
jgi:hypothetical protein